MKRVIVALTLLLAAPALWAQSVYYSNNSNHASDWATAAGELATSLGGTATGFNASSSANWTPVLADADFILVGQNSSLGGVDGATRTNIASWVSAGGVLLVLRESSNLALLNDVLGSSMTLNSSGCCNSAFDATKQAEVTGTSFDLAPEILPALNDFQPINPASLDPEAVAAYVDQYGSVHVMMQPLGSGLVGYYSWDWCCGDTVQDRDDWDSALLAGATFGGAVATVARFRVTKVFSDESEDLVDVTLSCNSGLPLEQTFTIAGGDEDGVTFVVTDIPETGADCEVTESGAPSGYTTDASDCVWTDVTVGYFSCQITNTAEDATFTVVKDWVLDGTGGDIINAVADVTIMCDAMIDGCEQNGIEIKGAGNSLQDEPNGCPIDVWYDGDYWYKSGDLGDGDTLVATVDVTGGSATCSATESIAQSGVESVASGCGDTELGPGASATCTFTNTVFFEGIPTLSQYGLAVLALLMLGVGFVGMRRFV